MSTNIESVDFYIYLHFIRLCLIATSILRGKLTIFIFNLLKEYFDGFSSVFFTTNAKCSLLYFLIYWTALFLLVSSVEVHFNHFIFRCIPATSSAEAAISEENEVNINSGSVFTVNSADLDVFAMQSSHDCWEGAFRMEISKRSKAVSLQTLNSNSNTNDSKLSPNIPHPVDSRSCLSSQVLESATSSENRVRNKFLLKVFIITAVIIIDIMLYIPVLEK